MRIAEIMVRGSETRFSLDLFPSQLNLRSTCDLKVVFLQFLNTQHVDFSQRRRKQHIFM